MNTLPLALKLGWNTLRARPTLSVLAVLLLAIGTAILGALFGLVFLLQSLQAQFTTTLALELELIHDSEDTRAVVMSAAEGWPNVESVQYVSPDVTLRDIEKETGEDLLKLFGTNPFPAMVRVRFGRTNLNVLDSLATEAKGWPDVADVVYPRAAWSNVDKLAARLEGGFGIGTGALALVVLVLVGLCLRAQVRNRAETWDFLLLMGASMGSIRLSLLVQQLAVGLFGGLGACALLGGLMLFVHWLTLRPVGIPFWFYLSVTLAAILLAILAGLLSPKRFEKR